MNMEINRVLILGIDALEYDLVEEWDLKNLKQEEYGKTELPLLPNQEPATVIIWPCFITGKMPKEMGFSTIHVFPQPIQRVVEAVYPRVRKYLIDYNAKDITEKKKGKQSYLDKFANWLNKMGLTHPPSKSDIISDTLFDTIPNSIHFHVPVYDNDAFPGYRKKVVDAIENPAHRPILEMQCLQEFKQRSREVFEWLERKDEWQLFMQYFFVLDAVQHVFYNNLKKIAKFYIMFDEFVGKVREKIDDDTLLLIVSDHGQKKGIHTTYGFYSVNKPLGLKNPKLIDFRWIIEEMLRKEN